MMRALVSAVILWGLLSIPSNASAPMPWASIPGTERITDIHAFLEACPSEDELMLIQADFPIVFEPATRQRDPLYSCSGATSSMRELSDQLAITQALRVIRHMKLSQPLPWIDLHPYEWLKSRIGAISVSYTAPLNSCCHIVFPLESSAGVYAITLQKASDELLRYRMTWRDPLAGTGLGNLILLIFHEARHIDVPHNCQGIYDSSLEYMGAWGVQITLAHFLSEKWIDVGLPPEELAPLGWLANDLEESRLCNPSR